MINITPPYTTSQDTKCAELWAKLTQSNNDSLSFDEFSSALTKNGVKLSYDALKIQWNILDTDGSGDMDLLEFKQLIKKNFEATDDKIILLLPTFPQIPKYRNYQHLIL